MGSRRLAEVFAILARAVGEGLVRDYALVGAVASIFYAETIRTYDLDVAVALPASNRLLVSLEPLYAWLGAQGFVPDREHVVIHGIPVQFLSSDPPLWADAVAEARTFDYDGVGVRVAGPEHLVLMALEAPSMRRRERAALLVESGAVDPERLVPLAARFGIDLPESWRA
jgi:hypothetical protein